MFDRNLVIIFIALTTLAVLIQTGILAGVVFVSTKLGRQTDRAMDVSRHLLGPLHKVAENLEAVSARVREVGASTEGGLKKLDNWWHRSA